MHNGQPSRVAVLLSELHQRSCQSDGLGDRSAQEARIPDKSICEKPASSVAAFIAEFLGPPRAELDLFRTEAEPRDERNSEGELEIKLAPITRIAVGQRG